MARFYGSKPEPNKKDLANVNTAIKADPVRLIDENGGQVGVVSLKDALSRAERAGLDLVEVSPKAAPPVCKILDYGKYKFQAQKKASEARKKQQVINVKEVSIRPTTEEHDYQIKLRNIRKFLDKGDKVKINLRFRGREITHQELGVAMLQRIENDTLDLSNVEQKPNVQGRQMSMVLSPEKQKPKPKEQNTKTTQ